MRRIMRELMRRKQWNDTDLAEASGVAQSVIHRFLSGRHKTATLPTIEKWAVALGVTESQLRGLSPLHEMPEMQSVEELEADQVRRDYLRLSIKHRTAVRTLISSLLTDDEDPPRPTVRRLTT